MATNKPASLNLSKLPLAARVGVGVALVGLVALAYFVLFFSDVTSQLSAAERQEINLRDDLAKARESESAYLADVAELTEKQQRQRELNKVLPETAEYPAFLSAVQSVANVTGVALNSWEPEEEVGKEFFSKVPMKLSLTGRFHQLAKFFYGISQLDRIINLEEIEIALPKREGDDVFITGNCMATAFHTLPQAAVSAEAPAAPAPATSAGAPR